MDEVYVVRNYETKTGQTEKKIHNAPLFTH